MRGAKIEIAPERIAEGKRLYELTATPVADIAAMMGVSRKTLERRIHEWGWVPRSAPRVETDRVLVAAQPPAPINAAPQALVASTNEPDMRSANAARIQVMVAGTLDAVQRVLANAGPADEGGAERSARTLAAVARTLQEMSSITKPDEETQPDDADDDPIPRDIDDIRDELARRIHALIDEESGVGGSGGRPGAAGDEALGR